MDLDVNGSYEFAPGLYDMDRFFCPLFVFDQQTPQILPVVNADRPYGFPASSNLNVGVQGSSANQYATFQHSPMRGTFGLGAVGGVLDSGDRILALLGRESRGDGVSFRLDIPVTSGDALSFELADQGDFWCSSGFRDLDASLLAVGPQGFTAMDLHKEWDIKRGMAAIVSVGANMAYNASFTSPSGKQWTAKANESPGGTEAMLCSEETGTWRFTDTGVVATSPSFAWADLAILDLPPERFGWFPCETWL